MERKATAIAICAMMLLVLVGMLGEVGHLTMNAEGADFVLWQYGQTGEGGKELGQLQDPGAADVLHNGSILIMDVGNARAIEVDPEGTIVWQYGQTGIGGTGFNQVGATAWMAQRLSNGNTLITDTQNHRVIEVDTDKNIIWQYGVTGSTSVLFYPRDAERLANGNTIVADTDHNRIVEVDESKNEVWSYSCSGVALPSDVDRLANGNTLICEPDNYRVIEIDSSSNIVWQYGITGSGGYGEGQVGLLWDADRLPNGNTLITDTQYHRIIEVSPSKQIVWQYGKNDTSGNGTNLLYHPWEADRLTNGSTLITEKGNHRVIIVGAGDENITVLFQDDLSGDLSAWNLYGDPKPFIDNGAIKGNGDGWYGSDAVTKMAFDRTKGNLVIEARIKISQTLRPGWFGYGEIVAGDPDYDPVERTWYGFRFQGTLYGEQLSFIYLAANDTLAQSSIPWGVYDTWHDYRVVVKRDGGADYFVDGDLKFSVPETEQEATLSNVSVIVGSHDPPYWFDNVSVKRQLLPYRPPARWSLTVSTDSAIYEPGDTVLLSASLVNLATSLPVMGELVSLQVDSQDGTPAAILSERTSAFGWANISFRLADDCARGPYTVFASAKGLNATTGFRVGLLPLFIISVTHLGSYMPGDTVDVVVLAASAQADRAELLLVLQVMDNLRTPLTPVVEAVTIVPYSEGTVQFRVVLPSDASVGVYSLQVQLMTGLPRDRGYAVDIFESSITVG